MLQVLRSIEILMGGALFGMSSVVWWTYAKKIRRDRRKFMPWHVALISFSYIGFMSIVSADQYERLMNEATSTWRLASAFPFYLSGLIGLYLILRSLHLTPSGPERRGRPTGTR